MGGAHGAFGKDIADEACGKIVVNGLQCGDRGRRLVRQTAQGEK
jgi:hypothetical protein